MIAQPLAECKYNDTVEQYLAVWLGISIQASGREDISVLMVVITSYLLQI